MTETLPTGLIKWQRNWHIRFNPLQGNGRWTLWANSRVPTKLVAEMTPTSLAVYLVQLENYPDLELLPVQHSGFYRVFLPNVGPAGLLPKNIHFPGYVSPFTKQSWGGIANKFHNLSDVYKFIRAYPDLISRLFNQAPMVYAEPIVDAKVKELI